MKKKIIRIILIVLGIIIIAVAGLAIWYWNTISIMQNNNTLQGEVKAIPASSMVQMPPLTKGTADWICWRGIDGKGRSRVTGILTDWSAGLPEKWRVDYLCQGKASAVWSSPVIQGNRLVVCGRDTTHDLVFCLNSDDGSLLWKTSYPAAAKSSYGTGARATPWIDDDRVYTYGRSGDLVCWQLLDGHKIWHKNVKDAGGKEPTWGLASSPFILDSLIIVKGGGRARTIAYDKLTGEVIWKSGQGLAGYAAIAKMEIDNHPVLLSFHGKGLAAIAPQDGTELWNMPWETSYDVNATTPVSTANWVFITSGYGTGGQLLQVSQTEAKVVWKNTTIASHHSDPHIIDGHIYGYSGDSMQNRGSFKCVELKSGNEKWSTNEMGWGTCVQVDGYLLCMDIKGNLFLMQPNPEKFILKTRYPRALGKVKGAAWTIPVLANDNLYLRFNQKLVCYGIKSQTQSPLASIQ